MSLSSSNSDVDDSEFALMHGSTSAAKAAWCPAEVWYCNKNQSLKSLDALCSGMKDDDGNDLMDVKSFPWN
jgi:hypothetical protein